MQAFEEERRKIELSKAENFMIEIAFRFAEEDLECFESADQYKEPMDFPAPFEEKMLQEMKSARKKAQKQRGKVVFLRSAKVAAILLLCFGVFSLAMVSTVDAFRMRLSGFIVEENGSYYDIRVMPISKLPESIKDIFPEEWEFTFYPAGVPQGFELVDVFQKDQWKYLVFENGERFIRFSYIEDGFAHAQYDMGEVKLSETQVGKHKGLCVKMETRHVILWNQSGYSFRLNTDITFKDGVKIAEDIVYIDL